jgi:hypothetical protein
VIEQTDYFAHMHQPQSHAALLDKSSVLSPSPAIRLDEQSPCISLSDSLTAKDRPLLSDPGGLKEKNAGYPSKM